MSHSHNATNLKVTKFKHLKVLESKMIIEETTINIPVCDDKLIIENEGNDYINDKGKLVRGRVIVRVKCLHSNYYKRVNEYDVMLLSQISDDEINNGYKKTFKYFDSTITLKCKDPKSKIKKGRIVNKIPECGLTYYENGNIKYPQRGDLFIILFEKKDE